MSSLLEELITIVTKFVGYYIDNIRVSKYNRPDLCPKTHQVYHETLCSYVLQQVQHLARSMRRRKINSPIKDYAEIEEISTSIIKKVIDRIEINHAKRNAKPSNVIYIYWNLV